ncbi:RNA polymerase sigma factor [Phaeobacter sp. B1627]|uniref:RNA polymerase sigma factor n=1 Tax=Phaeobacter sp. B1627 TaxID=2583809 RepID=UPI0011192444|nr:RNA polymerase sigma factor [Phaeobacter sp. B1627]TNJ47475.1 RNA polymerase sigma factor [Phaeobacter sp. B1627]
MNRQDAKAELISHMKVLRAFAMSLTRNDAAADDLVQDTVLKAWTNLEKFQEGTNMRAWLFTILRNTFYSNRRKAVREVEDSTGSITESISVKPAHDGRLQLAEFRAALNLLPAEQREVLTLIGVLQYSYEEAAEVCGVKVGTIKSRLNRGREALALKMQINAHDRMELTDAATHAVVSASGGTAA